MKALIAHSIMHGGYRRAKFPINGLEKDEKGPCPYCRFLIFLLLFPCSDSCFSYKYLDNEVYMLWNRIVIKLCFKLRSQFDNWTCCIHHCVAMKQKSQPCVPNILVPFFSLCLVPSQHFLSWQRRGIKKGRRGKKSSSCRVREREERKIFPQP